MRREFEAQDFIVSDRQVELDTKMSYYDVRGTIVHALMLNKIGVISESEIVKILQSLKELEKDCLEGRFKVDPQKGAQLTLENLIIEKTGTIGYKVHTARSRNDQVMVTELLYLKDGILDLLKKSIDAERSLLSLAISHIDTIMPGYTHMQPAKPTTLGQWALSYFDSLMRGIMYLKESFEKYDMNPLGAVESYGTSWRIDRQFTTELLGFSRVWEIPQDVISSRGLPQLDYLRSMSEISLAASKLAQDLLLLNTFEYGMVELGDEVAQRMHPITGSSVMAQKKNPDVLELIRSTAPQIIGFENIVANLLSSLPMGYNRDSREVKEYMELGMSKVDLMLSSLEKVLSTLVINKEKMKKWVTEDYTLTTDLADYIAQKSNIGYRLVYKVVGKAVDDLVSKGKPFTEIRASDITRIGRELGIKLDLSEDELKQATDLTTCIEKRVHIGGSSRKVMKEMITKRSKSLEQRQEWIDSQTKRISESKEKTDSLVDKIIGAH